MLKASWIAQMNRVCPMKVDHMINLYLAMFHTFYISICFMALELFMCYQHPNSKYSLVSASEVICYDTDEWKGMLTEGVFNILVYIVAPIMGFMWVVFLAPQKFHMTSFHTRWKFLFIKFKPNCYWWSVFHMLRTLSMCVALVLSQEGSRQVYLIGTVNLLYGVLLVIHFPWRHRTANLFDLFVTSAFIFFCTMSASFSRHHVWLDDQIAELAVTVTFVPLVVVILLALWVAWKGSKAQASKSKKKRLELAANAKTVFTRFVGMDKKAAEAWAEQRSQQDRDLLTSAAAVIVAELLGHQPGTFALDHLPWRLVHKEQKSGARKWMPGEKPSENNAVVVKPPEPPANEI
jgi:hypothetical protein